MKDKDLFKEEDSLLFLEFIKANGFDPNHYRNILELIQSVPNSMSKYLSDYRQFLLSQKVQYSQLENNNVKGAFGYLDGKNGIVVPKTIEADQYFHFGWQHEKKHGYDYPSIKEFDLAIAYHDFSISNFEQIQSLLYCPIKNHYIGFIGHKEDNELGKKISLYRLLLESINAVSPNKHTLIHDTIKKQDKEFYLIKKI